MFTPAFTLSLAALLAVSTPAQDPLLERRHLKSLENVARTLARSGRADEMAELIGTLVDLGLDDERAADLRKAADKLLERAKETKPSVPAAARGIRKAAAQIAKLLPERAEGDRRRIAEILLRLDSECEDARAALGHELVHGQWLSAEGRALRARRGEIEDALRRARHLTVEVESGPSDDPLVAAVLGRPGSFVRCGPLEVHSSWSESKLRRSLTQTVRALAVSRWLIDGELAVPEKLSRPRWVLLHRRAEYNKAVDFAEGLGKLRGTSKKAKSLSCFFGYDDFIVDWNRTEADTQASLISRLADELSLPCLSAGHRNWLCLTMFGTSLPGYVWEESKDSRRRPDTVARSREAEAEYWEHTRLVDAGLRGSRSWMAYLAARGEDPPWSRSFLDAFGKIVGDNLCKSTIVMDFLYEHGPIPELFLGKGPDQLDTPAQIGHVEKGLKEPIARFEARWREWLCPPPPSLAERVDEPAEETLSKGEKAALEYLNSIRSAAFLAGEVDQPGHVKIDPSLSLGARLHAEYLDANEDQLSAWPDAHEEFPDREGFTPQGAWGGLHSVIAPRVSSPEEAIDRWLGTFYHRLPLLETGLLRIGWGRHKGTAVLDAESLVRPRQRLSIVLWPHGGMKDVPTRFEPELPNPVPGVDQDSLGYPITLQLGERSLSTVTRSTEVNMTLHVGKSSGPTVDCYYSTPSRPTNPELAPTDVWCLIPKQPLKKNTTYFVVVQFVSEDERVVRRFDT